MLRTRRKFKVKRSTVNTCAIRRRIARRNTHRKVLERRRAFNLLVEAEAN
ncbi:MULTISPECIES: hypothetical protein [unclassified Pseudoalteromonas]|nr:MULTISPECIES: hypothetical protein [unclassified Pseudoalteromonas]KPV95099.1 hypothetical protein AN214_02892 [Pseudoalteromonas sp. P1-9]MCF6459239.1 hypothetical protein [Pseudoalteromonas sp. MMG024]